MFYNSQLEKERKNYEENLKLVGSLSNLFSTSITPYLYYRVAEKVFCDAFLATNLSRSDVALDATKNSLGIGLKTFLASNYKSFQKVAEFNKDKESYENKLPNELISVVSNLRNERIKFAENLYSVEKSIYHCVVRDKNLFKIYEEDMSYIDIKNIQEVKKKKNSIIFHDSLHEYSFNLSKSTLTKRFNAKDFKSEFEVEILKDPLSDIRNCLQNNKIISDSVNAIVDTVYLPLYGKDKFVYERSGLNQWNAKGRERDINEVYIPIPAKVHNLNKNFFQSRDKPFNMKLPNGKILQSKVCQDNSKALMSYSNKELGKWILRDVLSLKEGELLTYDKLRVLGIDSVRIDKYDDENYNINFALIDSYEDYIQLNDK